MAEAINYDKIICHVFRQKFTIKPIFSLLCDIDKNFFCSTNTERKKTVVEMRNPFFFLDEIHPKKKYWRAKTKAKKKQRRWNAVIKYQAAISTLIKLLTFFGLAIVPRIWHFIVFVSAIDCNSLGVILLYEEVIRPEAKQHT